MAVSHYVKRELETVFVHVFSRKSMPLKRLFINSAHYWILFGLLNSIELFCFPKEITYNKSYVMLLLMFWALMQFLNLKCHQELASFRKKSSASDNTENRKNRGIPKGWGFQYVSCANYLWETLGWLGFSILTKCYTSFLFTFVSGAQMAQWALKKHKQYKQEFGEKYPKERKALLPFLLWSHKIILLSLTCCVLTAVSLIPSLLQSSTFSPSSNQSANILCTISSHFLTVFQLMVVLPVSCSSLLRIQPEPFLEF